MEFSDSHMLIVGQQMQYLHFDVSAQIKREHVKVYGSHSEIIGLKKCEERHSTFDEIPYLFFYESLLLCPFYSG